MIKSLFLQSTSGFFLKTFLKAYWWWIEVNMLNLTLIIIQFHVEHVFPSKSRFILYVGIVIMTCCWLDCDYIALKLLYLLLFTWLDFLFMIKNPLGSMYEGLNMLKQVLKVITEMWVLICIKVDFDHVKLVISIILG